MSNDECGSIPAEQIAAAKRLIERANAACPKVNYGTYKVSKLQYNYRQPVPVMVRDLRVIGTDDQGDFDCAYKGEFAVRLFFHAGGHDSITGKRVNGHWELLFHRSYSSHSYPLRDIKIMFWGFPLSPNAEHRLRYHEKRP